jgi:hypothetical protein
LTGINFLVHPPISKITQFRQPYNGLKKTGKQMPVDALTLKN